MLRLFFSIILTLTPLTLFAQGHRGEYELPLDKSLLELPAIEKTDVILVYSGFVVNYNTEHLIPNWVAYELTADEVDGDVPRATGFSMDLSYKDRQAMREDYSNTGWDKGHMAPSADMKWSKAAMTESFHLTNICPQNHELNGRDWHVLENRVRSWARQFGHVWVVCGPIVKEQRYGTIGEQGVVVPDQFFKALLRQDENGTYQTIAFVFDNDSSRQPLKDAMITVGSLEALTGYDLFANLDDDVEVVVESQAVWENWQ